MSPTTTIHLVRHGATTWNESGRYQGRVDVPMSDEGVNQVRDLARRLGGMRFDAAYCSSLVRATATAALLLEGTGCRAMPLRGLDELSYGALQGLTPRVRAERYAMVERQWRATPWQVTFPEGESLADVAERVTPIWEGIVAGHAGDTVLVAAHGHVNRVLLLHALGLPPEAFWHLKQENASCWVVRGADAEEYGTSTARVCRV